MFAPAIATTGSGGGADAGRSALFEDNVQHFIGKPPIPYNKAAVGLNWDTSDVMFIGNDFTGAMSLWGSQDGSATTVIDGGENTL